jgi:type I restriction enzyme S subunit
LLITNEIEKIIAKSVGSAQQHINKNIINEYKITLPTASIVKQFKQIVNPYFVAIATLYGEIENLISARDALLPKLMSGELKV